MIRIVYLHGLPDVSRAQLQPWLDELPPAFRDRLQRQRRPARLLQSLTGLQLLKLAAAQAGVDGFRLAELETSAQGKPRCRRLVDFSISHSDDLVACALSDACAVGLDVEHIRPVEPTRFARTFTPAERAWIGDDRERFFELWTRKEAVIKLSGEHGIAHMRQIELDGQTATLHGQRAFLRPLSLHQRYCACLATAAPATEITLASAGYGDGTWQIEGQSVR